MNSEYGTNFHKKKSEAQFKVRPDHPGKLFFIGLMKAP